jgi:hypothetical protein
VGHTSPHASTAETLTFKSVFSSHPNIRPITSTISPLNIASSKPSIKHSYYTKDLITSSWYQTRPPQRLTSKAAMTNNLGLSTKSVGPLKTNVNSPLSTAKGEYSVSEGPPDVDTFLSPGSFQGNAAARTPPPVIGRPHECSNFVAGTSSSAGGGSTLHHYLDNESPMCQVCMSMLY